MPPRPLDATGAIDWVNWTTDPWTEGAGCRLAGACVLVYVYVRACARACHTINTLRHHLGRAPVKSTMSLRPEAESNAPTSDAHGGTDLTGVCVLGVYACLCMFLYVCM